MVGKPVGMRFYQHLNTDGSTLLFIQEDIAEWRSSNPGHNFIEGSPPADIRRTLHTSHKMARRNRTSQKGMHQLKRHLIQQDQQ